MTLKATALDTVAALRADPSPEAVDRATSLILALINRQSAMQYHLEDAAASLAAIVESHDKGTEVSAAIVQEWARSATTAARSLGRDGIEAIATMPWLDVDAGGTTNPQGIDVLLALDCQGTIQRRIGRFTPTGLECQGPALPEGARATHYAPILTTQPTMPHPLYALGRAAGMAEAAEIVRTGEEITDPLDDHESTIMEDFPTMDDAADAIMAAL